MEFEVDVITVVTKLVHVIDQSEKSFVISLIDF